MDLAKGEDLSTILRRRRGAPMPLDEALAILRPLASALDYAHGEHVLHRDVKPANVKVDGIRVQLLDFGLAAEVRSSMSRVSLRGHAGSSGTPAYMAPEQWEARRQSAATDQYSLAVMAYEMLSGYRPFDTDNMELLKSAVLTRAPEEIEGVPAYVNATLQKDLAKNPKERFASCTEFVEAISNAEPQSAQRDSHTETQRHGESISGAAKPVTRIPNSASTPPISEADVLRRKLALTRSLKAIAAEDRADKEFSKFVAKAEDELAVAEEACKFGRFAAAAESLNVAENALCDLQTAKRAREEAERKATEEAERKARAEAERKEREWIGSRAGERKTIRIGSQEVALRWCPSGTFTMGSPASEEGRHISEMQYRVTLTKGFWMGETQVTQGLWKEVMGSNPSLNKSGDDYPVENVSWNDCQEFLRKLNARTPQSGLTWALPTEAQWEYACRAGSTGAYAGNGRLDDMGWYIANSGNTTHPVARKKPNAWGLYDMHGNVWEWCQNDPFGAVTDPTGAVSGSDRVLRGGGYWGKPQFCRSAYRNWDSPGDRYWSHGFRLLAFQDGK
jgi:formylglycine-generating enzyme required for sulfatase activity